MKRQFQFQFSKDGLNEKRAFRKTKHYKWLIGKTSFYYYYCYCYFFFCSITVIIVISLLLLLLF